MGLRVSATHHTSGPDLMSTLYLLDVIPLNQDFNPTLPQFKLTEEHKVLRDPIHGYINIYYQVIWDLIGTPEFQKIKKNSPIGRNATGLSYCGALPFWSFSGSLRSS